MQGYYIASRWLLSAFRSGVQAVADFLIEDRCILCRHPAAADRQPFADARLRALTHPVPVRVAGPLRFDNHPVCGTCAGAFIPTTRVVTLAEADAAGVLKTPSGACFRPAVRPRAGEAARADDFRGWGPSEPSPGADPAEPVAWPGVRLYAAFMTSDPVLGLVHAFKYSGYKELADPLGRAMGVAARPLAAGAPPVLVPMPMTGGDRRRRGFDAVERLARVVARRRGWMLASEVLHKRRQTAPQSRTPHERRAANVRGAFGCTGRLVQGRRVILVDDLVTTGATATAAAAEILHAGADSVDVLALARAL